MPELVTGITGRVESGGWIGLSARIEPVRLQECFWLDDPPGGSWMSRPASDPARSTPASSP